MMTPSALPSDRHWATVQTSELPGVLEVLKQRFWKSLEDSGRLYLWRKSERTYYGEDEWGGWKESAAVSFGGESGEMAYIRINEYRSLLISILSMCTADRPAFYAKAVNTSSQALIEAPIATGLIAFYYNDKRVDDLVQTTVERTLVLGEGFMHLRWDNLAGPPMGQHPQTGVMVYEGDIAPAAVSPLDVIRDTKEAPDAMKWCAVAHRENIWNLVAAYPQFADQLSGQRGAAWWPDNVWSDEFQRGKLGDEEDPDRVVVWCLYVSKSPAVPNGRYALICGDVVLSDEPMKLDEIPVYCCVASKHMDKNEGNAPAWDLLAPQDAYDSLWSSILTVHDSYNNFNLFVPKGSGITAKQIASGQRLIEYNVNPAATNGGMPMAMQFNTLPTAAYEIVKSMRERMQTLSGVNSVARGEVDDNVKSGTMAALIQSLAAKFNSAPQRATVRLHERVSAGLLKQLRLYGSTKKVSEVAGSGAAEYMKSISVADVEQVQKVQVETANPLTQQMAGRLELGEKMATLFPGKMTMEHFATLVETGQLKPLLKRSEAMLAQIARENDMLSEGKLPPVAYIQQPKPPLPGMPPLTPEQMAPKPRTCHPSDDHAIHVTEHACLLTTEFRSDPVKMEAFETHMTDHYVSWVDMPQDLGALTGQSLPPPAPPGVPMEGDPAKPEEPKGAAPPSKGEKKSEPEKARPLGGQPQPNMPSMPRPAGGGPPVPA